MPSPSFGTPDTLSAAISNGLYYSIFLHGAGLEQESQVSAMVKVSRFIYDYIVEHIDWNYHNRKDITEAVGYSVRDSGVLFSQAFITVINQCMRGDPLCEQSLYALSDSIDAFFRSQSSATHTVNMSSMFRRSRLKVVKAG